MGESKYFNRDLSWLSFNERVLDQIKDKSLPIYERIKFLAIYASNLDDFYRVRVASYRNLLDVPDDSRDLLNYSPEEILEKIRIEVERQQIEFENVFNNQIRPELEENGVILYHEHQLSDEHLTFVKDFFLREVLPYLQPVLLTPGDVLTFLQDNVIYLSVKMAKKRKAEKDIKKEIKWTYAVIKIPTGHLPRFIKLPDLDGNHLYFFLEDFIRMNLKIIFPGFIVDSTYCIKISRDADIMIDDEFSGNLLNKLRQCISNRKTGAPARFLYDREMPRDMLDMLTVAFNLSISDFVEGGRYLNFNDFFSFPNPIGERFELRELPELTNKLFEQYDSIIHAVRKHDIMLYFPYHTYNYVLRFFNEAATDPKVKEIMTTQYRVATNSAIVNALITAARNGKKVTVFVEVKARFDEEANIKFAEMMAAAGIKVISSIPGLKVHAKAALIIRKSSSKENKRQEFAFLSSGNFNEKTAKQYSDLGFFTSDKEIIDDLKRLFVYLEDPFGTYTYKNILVPRVNLLEELFAKIDKEILAVEEGRIGKMILKVNGLDDRLVIDKLYEASQKGVEIDLIVRGICSLRPNMPYSANIKVRRIVDRFLEHSRIFAFYNDGEYDVYISSADLMRRNLHKRVESVFPIFNKEIKEEIINFLQIQLSDNAKACFLDENMKNVEIIRKKNEQKFRAQIETYLHFQRRELM